jgi:hypothetical protein
MGDILGSVAAITAGVDRRPGMGLGRRGWVSDQLDIIFGSWRLISDSVNVLLRGTLRTSTFVGRAAITGTEVLDAFTTCVWTISSGMDAPAHITHNRSIQHSDLLA